MAGWRGGLYSCFGLDLAIRAEQFGCIGFYRIFVIIRTLLLLTP